MKQNPFRVLLAFCLALPLLLQCVGVQGAGAAGTEKDPAKPGSTVSETETEQPLPPSGAEEDAGAVSADSVDRDLTPLPDEWFDDALFLGDSITATLQAWCTVNEAFGDAQFLAPKSYSIWKDVFPVRQIAYRAEYWTAREVIGETGAKKLFLMVGMNDIASDNGVENTMKYWDDYLAGIRESCPDVTVFIQSLVPTYKTAGSQGLGNEKVDRYNDELRSFCEENGCIYVDIASGLKDSDGNLVDAYSFDRYVHLNDDGAAVWAEQLKNPANYSVDPRSVDHEK